jgi:hypothetical protein
MAKRKKVMKLTKKFVLVKKSANKVILFFCPLH